MPGGCQLASVLVLVLAVYYEGHDTPLIRTVTDRQERSAGAVTFSIAHPPSSGVVFWWGGRAGWMQRAMVGRRRDPSGVAIRVEATAGIRALYPRLPDQRYLPLLLPAMPP